MSRPLILFSLILCLPLAHRFIKFFSNTPTDSALDIRPPLKHLAIIMDGNRRWAEKRNLVKQMGHRRGAETVRRVVHYCLEHNIEIVSVYAFSLENFQRSPEEISAIFSIMIEEAQKALPDLIKNGVQVRFIGDTTKFPETIRDTIARVERETAEGSKLLLNVLFCYGGRQEILSAVKAIVKDVKDGKINDIDEETFKKYLWTNRLPDPDLIIRTGGVKRLSNFLTYQTTYSELYFTDRLWPELTAKDLDDALKEYTQRKRNFGK